MSRFLLSPGAISDLYDIGSHLLSLPRDPGLRIGKIHEQFTAQSNEPIYQFTQEKHLFLYAADRSPIEFVGIIHGARDIHSSCVAVAPDTMLDSLELHSGNPRLYPFSVPAIASLRRLEFSPSRITFFTGETAPANPLFSRPSP